MHIEEPGAGGEVTRFADGSDRTTAVLETSVVGRGTYLPGWRWSTVVGAHTGRVSQRHVGYVLSGAFVVQEPGGPEAVVATGQAFELGPGHDAWVRGDVPCVALDFAVCTGA